MNEKMLIPVSLLIAGLLIGTGVYFASTSKPATSASADQNLTTQTPAKVNIENDHIVGSKSADVFIIEYSDLECPFCKRYNDESSKQLIEKYAEDGKVGFVFRHMPLSSIHPSAFGEAIATECVAKLTGEEKFFEYKEAIFAETKSDGNFDTARLTQIATSMGVDSAAFETCLKDTTVSDKVTASFNEAVAAGIRGTPTVFVQLKDGQTYPVPADFQTIDESLTAYLNQL